MENIFFLGTLALDRHFSNIFSGNVQIVIHLFLSVFKWIT